MVTTEEQVSFFLILVVVGHYLYLVVLIATGPESPHTHWNQFGADSERK